MSKSQMHFEDAADYIDTLGSSPSNAFIPYSLAAAYLNLEVSTVQKYVRDGQLTEVVIGPDRSCVGLLADDVRQMGQARSKADAKNASVATRMLTAAAKNQKTIEYGIIMAAVGMDHTNSRHRTEIGRVLAKVSGESREKHGFMLSVLAVRKVGGRPNGSFYDLARSWELLTDGENEEKFFQSQCKKAFKKLG